MNIKDISKLAGVSVSTVSKIINGKDESISDETKQKVLDIVKEYNYVPYAGVIKKQEKSFLIGLIISHDLQGLEEIIQGVQENLSQNGYHVVLSIVKLGESNIPAAIHSLMNKNIDGLIICKEIIQHDELLSIIKSLPCVVIEFDTVSDMLEQINIDYFQIGYVLTEEFIKNQREFLVTILPNVKERKYNEILMGIRIAYSDHGVSTQPKILNLELSSSNFKNELKQFFYQGINGLICVNEDILYHTFSSLIELGIGIPDDISISGVGLKKGCEIGFTKLTQILLPFYELGSIASNNLLEQIEIRKRTNKTVTVKGILDIGKSINYPKLNKKKKKIVVVGGLNMDVILRVEQIPKAKEVHVTSSLLMLPGGKGANQALGAVKLGADVHLIGRIGNDQEGKLIYNSLFEQGVNLDGVMLDEIYGTGKAYIQVGKNGESCIVIYTGANYRLDYASIQGVEKIFNDAEFCLIPMEIPYEVVKAASFIAKQKNVKVILKPSTATYLDDELLHDVEILIPNEVDLNNLIPQNLTLEEKADYFLSKGVKHIIVTLGEAGCFYASRDIKKYFPAYKFEVIDVTGASDAFISALAVYLSEGNSMVDSIKFATYAAAICITREGVQPALADRCLMNAYLEQINNL